MKDRDPYQAWGLTPSEAVLMQKELRDKIILTPLKMRVRTVGGADVSMNRFSTLGYAGITTLSFPDLKMISHNVVKGELAFPYIPGLLSFREIPLLLEAWEGLERRPDVLMVDGVGIAHPRRMGIATHLGLILGVPTIGCAKSVLTGTYEEPGNSLGNISYLYDRTGKEILGAAVRTKPNVRPIFVSPGCHITLEESVDLVRRCVLKHRLPEPTRTAHNTVNEYRVRG